MAKNYPPPNWTRDVHGSIFWNLTLYPTRQIFLPGPTRPANHKHKQNTDPTRPDQLMITSKAEY